MIGSSFHLCYLCHELVDILNAIVQIADFVKDNPLQVDIMRV